MSVSLDSRIANANISFEGSKRPLLSPAQKAHLITAAKVALVMATAAMLVGASFITGGLAMAAGIGFTAKLALTGCSVGLIESGINALVIGYKAKMYEVNDHPGWNICEYISRVAIQTLYITGVTTGFYALASLSPTLLACRKLVPIVLTLQQFSANVDRHVVHFLSPDFLLDFLFEDRKHPMIYAYTFDPYPGYFMHGDRVLL